MGRQSFGTIDKRGTASRPRYRARFDDPTYTGPGRAPRISAPHTFPTKREAEVWLAAQWSAIAAGTWEHPAAVAARDAEAARQQSLRGLTVAEWAAAWLADLDRAAAAGTLRKRRSDLRRHILPYTALGPAAAHTPLPRRPGADGADVGLTRAVVGRPRRDARRAKKRLRNHARPPQRSRRR